MVALQPNPALSEDKNKMSCCKSVPTFGVLQVNLTATTATLVLDGALPVSGNFNVRVCGNCLDRCSALPIQMQDATGLVITNIIGRCCGNRVLLNKVAVQARKHKCLHFCRSATTAGLVLLTDKICAPTPVVTVATAAAADIPAVASVQSTKSKASA